MTTLDKRSLESVATEILKRYSSSPIVPARHRSRIDIGREAFKVEQMPDGALPIYFPNQCTVDGHPGYGGRRSDCTHDDCVVEHVLEE